MLRLAVLAFGAVLIAVGVLGLICGVGIAMLWPLGCGALLLVGTVFEPRYKRNQGDAPGSGFLPTGERFIDPGTGKPVEVWYDHSTGERRYVNLTQAE